MPASLAFPRNFEAGAVITGHKKWQDRIANNAGVLMRGFGRICCARERARMRMCVGATRWGRTSELEEMPVGPDGGSCVAACSPSRFSRVGLTRGGKAGGASLAGRGEIASEVDAKLTFPIEGQRPVPTIVCCPLTGLALSRRCPGAQFDAPKCAWQTGINPMQAQPNLCPVRPGLACSLPPVLTTFPPSDGGPSHPHNLAQCDQVEQKGEKRQSALCWIYSSSELHADEEG